MGVLDDAIREHLDLKRRRGATDEEIASAEAEALGPARRALADDDDDIGVGETMIIAPVDDPAPPPPPSEPTHAVHDIDEDPMAPPRPVDRVDRPSPGRPPLDGETVESPPVDELPFDDDDDGDSGRVSD